MEQTTERKADLYKGITNSLPFSLAVIDGDGFIIETNRKWESFGVNNDLDPEYFEKKDVNYLQVCKNANDEFSRRAVDGIESVLSGEKTDFRMEYPCHSDDSKRWFILQASPLKESDQDYYLVYHFDITSRRLSEERSQRLSSIVDKIPICIITLKKVTQDIEQGEIDSDFTITNINPYAEDVTGFSHQEVLGKTNSDVFEGIFGRDLSEELSEVMRSNENYEEHEIHSTGSKFEDRIWNLQIFNVTEGYLSIAFEDVTRKVHNRERLEYLATYDELTELPNRDHFLSTFRDELHRADRYDNELTLILMDLDEFKKINDTYGHVMGDEVLEKIGDVILDHTRSADTAGRYGGEEFGILLPETSEEQAGKYAERLRQQIEEISLTTEDGESVSVTCSLGVSEMNKGDEEIKDILKRTDEALYEAKKHGRNEVVCWTDQKNLTG